MYGIPDKLSFEPIDSPSQVTADLFSHHAGHRLSHLDCESQLSIQHARWKTGRYAG